MGEQRLFLRKKVQTPLPIELLPGKEVWLDDLGEGGLSVSGSSPVELGTSTFFSFQFPDANSVIEAAGVVAWCGDSGRVGIRFTRIKPDSTAALKRWLNADLPALANSVEGSSENAYRQSTSRRFDIAEIRAEVLASGLVGDAVLQFLADRIVLLTRAGGAAIALRDGHVVTCRASSGTAPEVGTKLYLDATLSGECYRTGNIINVADAENDRRINAQLQRELEFRSLLIVPIVSYEEIVGIAEAFSPFPGNFEGGDILLLSSIAELIAEQPSVAVLPG
jgi:hypothetical protein